MIHCCAKLPIDTIPDSKVLTNYLKLKLKKLLVHQQDKSINALEIPNNCAKVVKNNLEKQH